jgi:DNA-binding NtrC family response regulator
LQQARENIFYQNFIGNETILGVEDDDQVRQIAEMVLNRFGYNVIQAKNGLQALDLWYKFDDEINLVSHRYNNAGWS